MKKIISILVIVMMAYNLISCQKMESVLNSDFKNNNAEQKVKGRYVSENCFYTDFEGESVVQTDVEDANTICQRRLDGTLVNRYPMGSDFGEIFYVDTDWLYYEIGENELDLNTTVYRVPIIKKGGNEELDISKKEKVFVEKSGLADSDYVENSCLEFVDHTFYYMVADGLGTYNIDTKEQKKYKIDNDEDLIAGGTSGMLIEDENGNDVFIDLKTKKRQKIKSDAHPWIRLGKNIYFYYPYDVGFGIHDSLLDMNTNEEFTVITKDNIQEIANEMKIPWNKDWKKENESDWDGVSIDYIGYYHHRVYAQVSYPTSVTDSKNQKKISFYDGVCVSRNMDQESDWKVEKTITDHARKQINQYYEQASKGEYRNPEEEYELDISEGIANGIFYFDNLKNGQMDIYDIDLDQIQTMKRNDLETIYPFYDNHELVTIMHSWQSVLSLAPLMSQSETVYDQEQKKKYMEQKYK